MTPPHPRATGSYGPEAIEWCKEQLGVDLRWWQQLAFVRQLEHDKAGKLVWQNVIESTPRRAGKSVRLRAMALWRISHRAQFGEEQLVLHTGKDLFIIKEIHRRAWRWAEEQEGWWIRKANGHEEIQTDTDDRWMCRSTQGIYGYDVTLGMVDEAWAVDPGVVDEGLEPALLEREQPQLLLTSTAHRRATSLMKRRLAAAVSGEDDTTLLMLWGASPEDDPHDPETWRLASPHWTPQRHTMIRNKLERALAGELDPEADDLDPMSGFTAQYLNIWPPLDTPRTPKGKPLTTEEAWGALACPTPAGPAPVAAIEAWFKDGLSVAEAWPLSAGQVAVRVTSHATLESAIAQAASSPTLLAGKSLCHDARLVHARPSSDSARNSVQATSRLLADGVLRYTPDSDHLTRQMLDVRVIEVADGIRVGSNGRTDALKVAAWCAAELKSGATELPAVF